ncbi:MAG: 4Fe-4S binding protein, partial [Clostridia bacterium]|nr:4Fe-4S binding protein [Clostridia bacterium]
KVYAMKENGAYAQHRYQHHVINPNGASWSLRSDADAITFVDNIAHIDYALCNHCGLCSSKCPRKIILDGSVPLSAEESAE